MPVRAAISDDCVIAMKRVVGDLRVRAATDEDAIDGVQPHCVVEPGTPAELAQVLSLANGAGLCVIPRGSGTKLDWGNPPKGADIVLSTRRLDRILEHASGDMTATVQAGCTVAAFNHALAERGQRLALDPLWPGRATIGGIIATDDSGPLRAAFGTLRDHLIGITVALADGTIAKSGGKVVKNVAGYDLPKLFTGSFGTLGVITEATFRLYPLARSSAALRFAAPDFDHLGRVLSALAGCSLVTAAVQIEIAAGGSPGILVLVEGLPDAIEGKVRRVVGAVVACGARQVDVPGEAWTARERLFADPQSCVAKVSVLPTQWPHVLAQVCDVATQSGVRWEIIAQAVGVGLLRLETSPGGAIPARAEVTAGPRISPSPGTPGEGRGVGLFPVQMKSPHPNPLPAYRERDPEAESAEPATKPQSSHTSPTVDVLHSLRAHLEKMGGSLVLLRCAANVKARIDVWPDVGNALPLMRRIKDQFDPKCVLSPGRFVGGI